MNDQEREKIAALRARIAKAVLDMRAIPFFPTDEYAQGAIMRELERFVRDPVSLRWLIDAAINSMRKWGGIPELRGLYCARYRPADGREETCSLRGFSSEDNEASRPEIAAQLALPAPTSEPPLSDQEREEIAALDRKIKFAAAKRSLRKPQKYEPPDWLRNLG